MNGKRVFKINNVFIRFYQMRAERLEWFADRNPLKPEIEEFLDLGLFLPLETKDINNYQVFIIRTGVHNPSKHDQNDVLKVRWPILKNSLTQSISQQFQLVNSLELTF